MRKKVIGYQLKENGKPLKCYKNGRLALVLEDNNVFMTSKDVNDFIEFYNVNMRNVEIVKVFEGTLSDHVTLTVIHTGDVKSHYGKVKIITYHSLF